MNKSLPRPGVIVSLMRENAELTEAVLERDTELVEVMQENARLKERLDVIELELGGIADALETNDTVTIEPGSVKAGHIRIAMLPT